MLTPIATRSPQSAFLPFAIAKHTPRLGRARPNTSANPRTSTRCTSGGLSGNRNTGQSPR
eukprot:316455-Alexandrium_andersonii.AAC.1